MTGRTTDETHSTHADLVTRGIPAKRQDKQIMRACTAAAVTACLKEGWGQRSVALFMHVRHICIIELQAELTEQLILMFQLRNCKFSSRTHKLGPLKICIFTQ
jgi:hypothetical protein